MRIKRKGGGQAIVLEGQHQSNSDMREYSPRKGEDPAEGSGGDGDDKIMNSLESLKLRGLLRANYLFNTVSRDKLQQIEQELRPVLPDPCRYQPRYKIILERPYEADFSKSKLNHHVGNTYLGYIPPSSSVDSETFQANKSTISQDKSP
jgi:hypothetical protein